MILQSEIQRLKQEVLIADLLASRGIHPAHRAGGELAYRSPLRDDSHPSFFVNLADNVFADVVVAEHRGDVIRLVQLLDGCHFAQAVALLQRFIPSGIEAAFCLSGQSASAASREELRQIKLLQTPSLLRYVDSRGIHIGIARRYLVEIHYRHRDRYLYALGFENDKGGYALRNGVGCKRNLGPMGLRTIAGEQPQTLTANVFEGMFDFLSALQHFGQARPTYPTYVLNSVSNLAQLLPVLAPYHRINAFLDRDKAGRHALTTLSQHQLPVVDRSGLYRDYPDFNDWLMGRVGPLPDSS